MRLRIHAAALLAMASCGGTTSDAAAPPLDPRLQLAIAVPADTPSLHVPHAWIEGTGAHRGCIPGGPLGPATCATMRVDGDRLFVGFALEDRAWQREVSAGEATVLIARVTAETPPTAPRSEADIQRLFPDADLIRRVPVDGGFAVIIAERNQPAAYDAFARLPLPGGDVYCDSHSLGRAPTYDEAMTELDLCLALRAP